MPLVMEKTNRRWFADGRLVGHMIKTKGVEIRRRRKEKHKRMEV